MEQKKRILIIQTAFLGDVLLSVPFLRRLRRTHPSHQLHFVCRTGVGQILKQIGLVEEIHEIKKGNWKSYQRVLQQFKEVYFDLIYCPHESFTTARFLFSLHGRIKVGYQLWWNRFFFHFRVKKNFVLPEAVRLMQLLATTDSELAQNIDVFAQEQVTWRKRRDQEGSEAENQGCRVQKLIPVPEWAQGQLEAAQIDRLVQSTRSFSEVSRNSIAIFPGSAWATKKWTESGFAELAKLLTEKGFQIVWMGGAGEEDLCARLHQQVPQSLNYCGQTGLVETLRLLAAVGGVVSNDSAGQHLAALLEKPTVGLFGPTIEDFGYRPWNSKAVIVEQVGIRCRPCGKHGHQKCPLGTHECMVKMSAQDIVAALLQII